MRHYDNTGVPHTCPLIDKVIDFIRGIPLESDINEEIEDFNKEKQEVVDILEAIRAHNANLREYGINKNMERDEFEADIESLQSRIEGLEKEIQEKDSEIAELECKIEAFQD